MEGILVLLWVSAASTISSSLYHRGRNVRRSRQFGRHIILPDLISSIDAGQHKTSRSHTTTNGYDTILDSIVFDWCLIRFIHQQKTTQNIAVPPDNQLGLIQISIHLYSNENGCDTIFDFLVLIALSVRGTAQSGIHLPIHHYLEGICRIKNWIAQEQ